MARNPQETSKLIKHNANGIVEQSHFKVREAIFKACNEDESKCQEWHIQYFGQKELLLGTGWDVHLILQQLALILYFQLT